MRRAMWTGVLMVACGGPTQPAEVVSIPRAQDAEAPTVVEPDAGVPTLYGENARDRYFQAEEKAAARDLEEARALFVTVKRTYVYSRYAPLSEKRIADIDFALGRWVDAAREYREFAHDHPTHEWAEPARARGVTATCLSQAHHGPCDDGYDGGL